MEEHMEVTFIMIYYHIVLHTYFCREWGIFTSITDLHQLGINTACHRVTQMIGTIVQ